MFECESVHPVLYSHTEKVENSLGKQSPDKIFSCFIREIERTQERICFGIQKTFSCRKFIPKN